MASSLPLRRLLSSSTLLSRSLLRPAASSNVLDVRRRPDRPLHHPRRLSSFPGMFDPFSWRRSVNVGQYSEYSSIASGVGSGDKEDTTKKNVLRPLSPHLPIYKPQLSSTTSILNRVSGIYLSAYVLAFYLVPLKMGSVCFSYGSFYQFLFYSSKLTLLSGEIAALALASHVYAGVRHLLMDFSSREKSSDEMRLLLTLPAIVLGSGLGLVINFRCLGHCYQSVLVCAPFNLTLFVGRHEYF